MRGKEWDEPGPDFGRVFARPPRRHLTREGEIRAAERRREEAARKAQEEQK